MSKIHFSKKGFTIVELSVVLLIISIVLTGVIKSTNSSKEGLRLQQELNFASTFDKAIKSSAELILDAYEPVCSVPNGTKWGWQNPSCAATSPFPAFDTAGSSVRSKIIYNLPQPTAMTTATRNALLANIIQLYSPYCISLPPASTTTLVLSCSEVTGLTYSLGGPALATPHGTVNSSGIMTGQGNIDPTNSPTYTLSYRRVRANGNVIENITYNGTFSQLWQKRQNYSMQQQEKIATALKGFHNTMLTLELNNQAPTGLNSVDDEFVPWFWRAFGPTAANVNNTALTCSVASGVCTASSVGGWVTGTVAQETLWTRMLQNILPLDRTVTIDGFGNALKIIPISSTCANTNLDICTAAAAPAVAIPADNYFSTVATKPPYVSIVYSATCNDTTIVKPAYCRNTISY